MNHKPDPLHDLRAQLMSASTRLNRARRRRRLGGAAIAVVVFGTPTVAIATGSFGGVDLGSGTAINGDQYRATQTVYTTPDVHRFPTASPQNPYVCDDITVERSDGSTSYGGSACRPLSEAKAEDRSEVPLILTLTSMDSQSIISGSVSAKVAKVTIAGVDDSIQLESRYGLIRRYFTASAPVDALVTAYDEDGAVLKTALAGPVSPSHSDGSSTSGDG